MYCEKCGQQINDEAVFCPNCGAHQSNDSNSVQPVPTSAKATGLSLTKEQLHDYISKIKVLEVSCYQQRKLCDRYRNTLLRLNTAKGNIPEMKSHCSAVTPADIIKQVPVAIWIFMGLLLVFILRITKPSIDRESIVVTIYTIIIAYFPFFLYFYSLSKKAVSKKAVERKNQEIDTENAKMQQYRSNLESQIRLASKDAERAKTSLAKTNEVLRELYSIGIIFPKYQSMVPVFMFDEYLSSGRCSTLEGHEGAYNIYENEARMDRILVKLDDIIERLDQIIENQYSLATALQESQQRIGYLVKSIDSSLQHIERNTAISAYYDEINGRNLSFLTWATYFRESL